MWSIFLAGVGIGFCLGIGATSIWYFWRHRKLIVQRRNLLGLLKEQRAKILASDLQLLKRYMKDLEEIVYDFHHRDLIPSLCSLAGLLILLKNRYPKDEEVELLSDKLVGMLSTLRETIRPFYKDLKVLEDCINWIEKDAEVPLQTIKNAFPDYVFDPEILKIYKKK